MPDRIFSATAGDLMTQEVKGKQASRPTREIYDWMEEQNYRVIPIHDGHGDPIGYVDKIRIEDKSVNIRHYMDGFSISNIIIYGSFI